MNEGSANTPPSPARRSLGRWAWGVWLVLPIVAIVLVIAFAFTDRHNEGYKWLFASALLVGAAFPVACISGILAFLSILRKEDNTARSLVIASFCAVVAWKSAGAAAGVAEIALGLVHPTALPVPARTGVTLGLRAAPTFIVQRGMNGQPPSHAFSLRIVLHNASRDPFISRSGSIVLVARSEGGAPMSQSIPIADGIFAIDPGRSMEVTADIGELLLDVAARSKSFPPSVAIRARLEGEGASPESTFIVSVYPRR